MFYVGLPAVSTFNYISRAKSSQGLGAGLQNIAVLYLLYLPLPLLLIHLLLPLFLHVLFSSIVSIQDLPSRFFTTSLSPTPTLASNLVEHSIIIRIYRTFIRDQRQKRVPPSLNGYR
jgi:hypothetical protein